MNSILQSIIPLLLITAFASHSHADWRQFRGNKTNGVVTSGTWSGEQEIVWSTKLPGRGLGSPVTVGDRVYITASSGPMQDRLHVLCFEAATGNQLWERQYWATGRTVTHPKTSVAAPSPASDGKHIFAFYSSNDVACLDLDGNLLWYRGLTHDYPNASNSLGMASSPVVAGQTLVVMVESDAESFSMGLNVETGQTRWKVDRPRKANWSSPTVFDTGKQQLVLLQGSAGVSAVDSMSGQVLWTYADGASTMPSLVIDGNTAYVPSHGLTAIQPGTSNAEVPEILWQVGNLSPATASPIILDESIFVVNSAGVITCAKKEDGQRNWQLRLKGSFSASPVSLAGKLFYVNEDGKTFAVDPSGKGDITSSLELGETILSTPAVDHNSIYVRSDNTLWRIAAK